MHINQRRVNSATKWTSSLLPNTAIRIVYQLAGNTDHLINRTGFLGGVNSNDTILPAIVGPVTRFNANGKYTVQKHLPKKPRYIRTIEWSYYERHGDDLVLQTEFVDINRLCYPRTLVVAPASEVTYLHTSGNHFIVAREMVIGVDSDEVIRHEINLFLEIYGSCEIRHANLNSISPPVTNRVNWIFLPPGQQSLATVRTHVNAVLPNRANRTMSPIVHRQQKIASYNPDEVWIGKGGFRAYVAYVFHQKGITVLESLLLDNATYVFGLNWATVSQLTKVDVLSNNLHINRIFHSLGWDNSIDALLR